MASYNKVILVGNLTRDPQLSYLPSQTPVGEFGLAVNRKWKSQDGQAREEVCFVDLQAYGRQAETINQYMAKGRSILIEGRLQLQQWTAQDGGKRSKLRVIVESFQFMGGGRAEGSGGYQQNANNAAPSQPQQQNTGQAQAPPQAPPMGEESQIPPGPQQDTGEDEPPF